MRRKVFGVSVSALIALQAARTTPAIGQVAVYEPALLMGTSGRYTSWIRRFDQEMARGQTADALITSIRGLDLAPPGAGAGGGRLWRRREHTPAGPGLRPACQRGGSGFGLGVALLGEGAQPGEELVHDVRNRRMTSLLSAAAAGLAGV